MDRNWNSLAFVVTLSGIAALLATQAESQVGPPKALVALQASTPGSSQSGHLNVSGTVRSGALIVNSFQLSTGAAAGRVLTSNASGVGSWAVLPGASGTANGDLSGTFPNPTVDGLLGRPLSTSAPTNGQQLTWTGTEWAPATDPASLWTPNGTNIHYMAGKVGVGLINPLTPVHAYSNTGNAITGEALVGSGSTRAIGGYNASTSGIALYGENYATSGNNYAIYGNNMSTSGVGVVGVAAASTGFAYGVYGSTNSSTGVGVFGSATTNSGTAFAVYGNSFSPFGTAVKGESFPTTGSGRGMLGVTNGTTGVGVSGQSLSLTGQTQGGDFSAASEEGTGVRGTASSAAGNTYGVSGFAPSLTGYAVWATGRSGASGTKSFRIDHPFDPANKYLLHYSAESPEPQNFYNGIVQTDDRGEAWIALPSYFEAINRDFRYNLTVIDDTDSNTFVQVKVAREIRDCKFKIRTSEPNVKVSWEVKAIRNDRWVQRNGAPTEVPKTGSERGRYLHPELYDQPANLGVFPPIETERVRPPTLRKGP